MKKILSLGVAAAVLSMTAIAASAAITPVILDEAVEGETITVEVVAEGMTLPGAQFTVEASDNLTLVEGVAIGGGFFANNTLAWAGTEPAADGTVLLTLTYTVDAAADEDISVTLTPAAGFEADVDADAVSAVVVAGAEDAGDLTSEESGESFESFESTETIDGGEIIESTETVDGGESVDAGESTESTETTNPDTGIALAVAPALLAGAAIVVAKKRK